MGRRHERERSTDEEIALQSEIRRELDRVSSFLKNVLNL